MGRWVLSLPMLAALLTVPALSQEAKQESKEKKPGLKVGQDLPGPFHPYNVTGPRAGRYHCLVTRGSLDPLVILFVTKVDDYTESLKALEEGLENRITRNPNTRLNSFTVFLSDEIANILEDDDKRDKIADELLTKAGEMKNVVFCLDNKADVDNYKLDDNAYATVVLVNKYKVVSVHTLTKDQLNPAAVEAILGEVGEKLGATKK
jgi:hypothetical protein